MTDQKKAQMKKTAIYSEQLNFNQKKKKGFLAILKNLFLIYFT